MINVGAAAAALPRIPCFRCDKIAASKNTDMQEARMSPPGDRKRKSPALPGFFDEYLFRSVHFASLAI
jgi:hypothetical protein